jgi:hypothetical protein
VNTLYTPDGVIYNPICFLFRENYHLWSSDVSLVKNSFGYS